MKRTCNRQCRFSADSAQGTRADDHLSRNVSWVTRERRFVLGRAYRRLPCFGRHLAKFAMLPGSAVRERSSGRSIAMMRVAFMALRSRPRTPAGEADSSAGPRPSSFSEARPGRRRIELELEAGIPVPATLPFALIAAVRAARKEGGPASRASRHPSARPSSR